MRTAIKSFLSKVKGFGRSVLNRLKPMDIDVKSAVSGLNELKSKEGFSKLPFEKQRELIKKYIEKIPFTK